MVSAKFLQQQPKCLSEIILLLHKALYKHTDGKDPDFENTQIGQSWKITIWF